MSHTPVTEGEEVVPKHSRTFLAALGLFFLELIKVVVLAVITIVLVRHFLFKPFYVKGQSMDPNYFEKDYLIINQFSYKVLQHDPVRGEVVVFRAPTQEKDFYLKRVIGLPGETVKVVDGKVVISSSAQPQGFILDESLYSITDTPGDVNVMLGPDQYFVMGDNRDASYDSRRFGPIDRSDVVGRAWLRGWPFNRVSIIDTPNYSL